MQDSLTLEREAGQRIPGLLSQLLATDVPALSRPSGHPRGIDYVLDDLGGRRWLFEVKRLSGPGRVAAAAAQLHAARAAFADEVETILVLVVPHMSPASADAAKAAGVSWLDLSGNASIDGEGLRVLVLGRPNAYPSVGRPASPFAPRSARVARTLLLDPERWWRQRDLVVATGLDDSQVSRTVRRLGEHLLLATREREVRPRDPGRLLDAWAAGYRFDRHDVVSGHLSGSGVDLARHLSERLGDAGARHAFTGLPAAWAIDRFATFRIATAYVEGDPRDVAGAVGMRREERGANVQLVGPNDDGVFAGTTLRDDLLCVSTVQVYLDLLQLPERAREAADHLRAEHLWGDGAG